MQQIVQFTKHFSVPFSPRGALSTYAYGGGGQSKKFSGNPKLSLQLQCNPKISAHFIYINQYMNMKYPQTMQIEVRIASIEHSFSFLWTQKYHFWQHSDPKISDLPPRICMCRVPPGLFLVIDLSLLPDLDRKPILFVIL